MKRFIEGEARSQTTLLPECLDDYIAEDNPVPPSAGRRMRSWQRLFEEIDRRTNPLGPLQPTGESAGAALFR